ncbi:unnamed protein product, partial [Clonostachys rosea]
QSYQRHYVGHRKRTGKRRRLRPPPASYSGNDVKHGLAAISLHAGYYWVTSYTESTSPLVVASHLNPPYIKYLDQDALEAGSLRHTRELPGISRIHSYHAACIVVAAQQHGPWVAFPGHRLEKMDQPR